MTTYDPKESKRHLENAWNLIRQKLGSSAEAVEELKIAIEIDPRNINAYNALANQYRLKGLYDEALSVCKKGFEVESVPPEISMMPMYKHHKGLYNLLGSIYHDIGNYDLAITAYQKNLEIEYNMEACKELGICYYKNGMIDEASNQLSEITPVTESSFMYYDACYFLGMALLNKGQKEKAIVEFKRALKINPEFKEAQDELSKLRVNVTAQSTEGSIPQFLQRIIRKLRKI